MNRNLTIRLTGEDKRRAKLAVLDSNQGIVRDDGSLWIISTVASSHYKTDNPGREQIYAAGNGVAEWLGLDSWIDIVTMQQPEHIETFKATIELV